MPNYNIQQSVNVINKLVLLLRIRLKDKRNPKLISNFPLQRKYIFFTKTKSNRLEKVLNKQFKMSSIFSLIGLFSGNHSRLGRLPKTSKEESVSFLDC